MQQFLDAADQLIARYGTRSIALHMRQVGDDHFGAGCWLTAHHAYSAALTKGADCPAADRMSLHVNRAAARIKLQMWEEAVEDCDAALALDVTQGGLPKTARKALLRRAQARAECGEADEARADLGRVGEDDSAAAQLRKKYNL